MSAVWLVSNSSTTSRASHPPLVLVGAPKPSFLQQLHMHMARTCSCMSCTVVGKDGREQEPESVCLWLGYWEG